MSWQGEQRAAAAGASAVWGFVAQEVVSPLIEQVLGIWKKKKKKPNKKNPSRFGFHRVSFTVSYGSRAVLAVLLSEKPLLVPP